MLNNKKLLAMFGNTELLQNAAGGGVITRLQQQLDAAARPPVHRRLAARWHKTQLVKVLRNFKHTRVRRELTISSFLLVSRRKR